MGKHNKQEDAEVWDGSDARHARLDTVFIPAEEPEADAKQFPEDLYRGLFAPRLT